MQKKNNGIFLALLQGFDCCALKCLTAFLRRRVQIVRTLVLFFPLCFCVNAGFAADLSPRYDQMMRQGYPSDQSYDPRQMQGQQQSGVLQEDLRNFREDDFRGTKIILDPANLPSRTIDYRVIEQPLRGILDLLARQSGVTIKDQVRDRRVVRRVRLSGTLDEALNALANTAEIQWITINDDVVVFPDDGVETKFYDIQNTSVKNIITTLQRAGIGGPGISLLVDNRQNFIRASGPRAFLDEFDEIVEKSEQNLLPKVVRYGQITQGNSSGTPTIELDLPPISADERRN
jgi:hypothetical protein